MEFKAWPKIPRLENKRTPIFTEKIDGTNACIVWSILPPMSETEDKNAIGFVKTDTYNMTLYAQSRTRFITPNNDNFGFARWAQEHMEELASLGEGYHFGEWWGNGIQRTYDQPNKKFSLFNTRRWNDSNPNRPACCGVVPFLPVKTPEEAIQFLKENGSVAAPGYMRPEGAVMYEPDTDALFKIIIDK
jgi:RNA ligase